MDRMKTMLRKAIPISWLPLVFLLLQVVGDFSTRQTLALVLVLAFVVYLISQEASEKVTPFSVTIHPKWYFLLKDYGLIDDEKWKALLEERESQSHRAHCVLRDGFSFTVLQPDLIYCNDTHVFFSRVDLYYGLRERISEKLPSLSEFVEAHPSFYVRLAEAGCEMGVSTPESWRNFVAHTQQWPFVPAATLPREAFPDHAQKIPFPSKKFDKHQKALKVRLSELGWKRHDAVGLESLHYEHKYVDVYVRQIV